MHNLSAAMDGIKVNLSFAGSFSQEQRRRVSKQTHL